MDWRDIADTVGRVAPALGGMVAGGAGQAVGNMISSALGVNNDPDAVMEALKTDSEAAVKLRQIEADMQRSVIEAQSKQKQAELEAETAQQQAVNETMRAELNSEGIWKSGWRAFVGWVMGLSFLMLSAAMAWGVVEDPSQLPTLMDGIVMLIVSMATVMGVNINARSGDKRTAMTGQKPVSLMESIATRVKK